MHATTGTKLPLHLGAPFPNLDYPTSKVGMVLQPYLQGNLGSIRYSLFGWCPFTNIYKFIWVMPLQKAHKLGYVRIPIFGAVQPRFGQSAFGKCTLDILHRRGAFFSVIACGSRVLTWDLFPNQSAYKKPSSKQHARNSIWVLLCLLFQPPTISFLNVA